MEEIEERWDETLKRIMGNKQCPEQVPNYAIVNKKPWIEFRDSGLLWWINMILHTFGWAICFEIDDNGKVSSVYPARVKFRGFDNRYNSIGYMQVSKYLKENAEVLEAESKE